MKSKYAPNKRKNRGGGVRIKITKVFQKSVIKGVIKNEINGNDTRDVIEGHVFVHTKPIEIEKKLKYSIFSLKHYHYSFGKIHRNE